MTEAAPAITVPERTGVIQWESLPQRLVTIWLPLSCFVIVLLFPFYWMTITALKSNEELYNFKEFNPLWVHSPTLANINKLLFETDYPQWLTVTMTVAIASTLLSVAASVLAAYAIQRLRFKGSNWLGLRHLPGLPGPALDPVHPAWPSWSSTSASTTARWR